MSNITTIRTNERSSTPLDVNVLNESLYMKHSIAPFIKEQDGTVTQSYANDVDQMYKEAHFRIPTANSAFQKVLTNFRDAHRQFVDLVDPERFESTLTPTVEGELCLTRTATIGGRVKLVMDEDLITFSYLPAERNSSKEILDFHNPEQFVAEDYKKLLYRFFEF